MLLPAGKNLLEKTHEYIVELNLDNIQSWFCDLDKCLLVFVAFEMITARLRRLVLLLHTRLLMTNWCDTSYAY